MPRERKVASLFSGLASEENPVSHLGWGLTKVANTMP